MRKDLTGLRMGTVTVIAFIEQKRTVYGNESRLIDYWRCRCDCGSEFIRTHRRLASKSTYRCAKCVAELSRKRNTTHGETPGGRISTEYNTYYLMMDRCLNMKSKDYAKYGGRGISICDRWRYGDGKKIGFEIFLDDMGRKPTSKHSIDRIDNTKGYSPGNCRWATPKEQVRNRGDTIKIDGEALADIAERHGLTLPAVKYRYRLGARGADLIVPTGKFKRESILGKRSQ